jgi:hypothetical protein
VATLLLFHFSLVLLNGLANAVSDLGTPSRNMAVLLGLSSLSRAISYSTPVILGLLIPTIFLQRSQYHLSKDRRRVITVVGILLLVGCLVVPTALVVRQSDLQGSPAWLALLAMIALLTILVGLSFVRLYRSMSSARPPSAIALFAAAVTLLVGLLLAYLEVTPYSYSSSPGTFVPIGWLFLSICLGAYLLFGFFNLSVAAVQAASSHWRPPAWLSKWIVILILGLVLPTTLLISGTERIAHGTTLISLGFRLNTLIVFFWLSGVAWILCQAGRSSLEVDEFTRWIGILAVSAVFYSTRSTWLYIPVTFLIGWFALTRLVRPASYWNMLSSIYENVFVKRSELLDQILDLNDAKSGYRALRKKEKEKLASDEVTIERYRAKLKVRREQLTILEQQARIEEWPIKDVALKFGPYDTARKNSLHGARMSFLFALPWVVLFLINYLRQPVSPWDPYPLWLFLSDLLYVLSKWTVIGFFLGYFYPYLLGNSGLRKGLFLFLALVLPSLPLMVVSNSTTSQWQASLFWILQVFVQCMLLGLMAFDYWTLREGKLRSWQMVFEIHGLTGVGVSISSILVAAGVAVTTLLTTQATNLVSLALNYVIPQVPAGLENIAQNLIR